MRGGRRSKKWAKVILRVPSWATLPLASQDYWIFCNTPQLTLSHSPGNQDPKQLRCELKGRDWVHGKRCGGSSHKYSLKTSGKNNNFSATQFHFIFNLFPPSFSTVFCQVCCVDDNYPCNLARKELMRFWGSIVKPKEKLVSPELMGTELHKWSILMGALSLWRWDGCAFNCT